MKTNAFGNNKNPPTIEAKLKQIQNKIKIEGEVMKKNISNAEKIVSMFKEPVGLS